MQTLGDSTAISTYVVPPPNGDATTVELSLFFKENSSDGKTTHRTNAPASRQKKQMNRQNTEKDLEETKINQEETEKKIQDVVSFQQETDSIQQDAVSLQLEAIPFQQNAAKEQQETAKKLQEVLTPFWLRMPAFRSEVPGKSLGIAGEMPPDSIRTNDIVTALLLACLVMTLLVLAHARSTIKERLNRFFYLPRAYDHEESTRSSQSLWLLCFQACIMTGILTYLYIDNYETATYVLEEPYQFIAIYTAMSMAFLLLRFLLYAIVNGIFFGSKKSRQFRRSLILVTSMEGMALFAVVLARVYFVLPMEKVIYCAIFVVVLVKLLTIYKVWVIFFRRNTIFLQIILYLCALEIIPLLSFGAALVFMTNEIKIIF